MSDFVRPGHKRVVAVLARFDRTLLAEAKCYFGGGTRIVLELGEYRESRDVDFLCSDQDGYRYLRQTVSETSLGLIAPDLRLARGVMTDQYGIRTFVETDGGPLKLEIVREARIDVDGERVAHLPVECLTRRHCFAEKLLANADRGLDTATLSRDAVDLAFMIEGWSMADAEAGLTMARAAYGDAVGRALDKVTARLRTDRAWRTRCIEGLAVDDATTMSRGLKSIRRLCEAKP